MNENQTKNATSTQPAIRSTEWLDAGKPYPEYRELVYMVMVSGDDVELMTVIKQALDSYPKANHKAVAAWFYAAYGQAPNKQIYEK